MLGMVRTLLDDTDSRVAYYSSAFLLKVYLLLWVLYYCLCMVCSFCLIAFLASYLPVNMQRLMTEDTDKYQHLLQNLILKAQQVKFILYVCRPMFLQQSSPCSFVCSTHSCSCVCMQWHISVHRYAHSCVRVHASTHALDFQIYRYNTHKFIIDSL